MSLKNILQTLPLGEKMWFSKLDPRNFGANGEIDRQVYFIDVKEEDFERAQNILRDCALIDEAPKKILC